MARSGVPNDPYDYLRRGPAAPGSSSYLPGADPAAPTDSADSAETVSRGEEQPASAAEIVARARTATSSAATSSAAVTSETAPVGLTRRELRALRESGISSTAASSTAASSTAAPSTAAQSTAAPSTAAPSTEAPPSQDAQPPTRASVRRGGAYAPSPSTLQGPSAEPYPLEPARAEVDSPWAPAATSTEDPAGGSGGRGQAPVATRLADLPRPLVWTVAVAALAVVGVLVWGIIGFGGANDPDATAPPTASADGTATALTGGPLLESLPSEVVGGEFASTGPSGTTYELTSAGWIDQLDGAPEGALESYVGVFGGGAEPVTLTGTRFGTPEVGSADATARAGTLGTAVDTGVVFPDENKGTYWVFNNDGLVTIVWYDGDLGSFSIVAEDAEAALDFYNGLSF